MFIFKSQSKFWNKYSVWKLSEGSWYSYIISGTTSMQIILRYSSPLQASFPFFFFFSQWQFCVRAFLYILCILKLICSQVPALPIFFIVTIASTNLSGFQILLDSVVFPLSRPCLHQDILCFCRSSLCLCHYAGLYNPFI